MSRITRAMVDYSEKTGISLVDLVKSEEQFWAAVHNGAYWNDIPARYLDRLDARPEDKGEMR